MDSDTVYELVKKLLGRVEAVGETNEDNMRIKNLKNTIKVVDGLLTDIYDASKTKDDKRYSMKEIGICADKYIKSLQDYCD